MPREYTEDEVRMMFLKHCLGLADYWADQIGKQPVGYDKPIPPKSALEGVVFSIMVALDGGSMNLPGFIVAPQPHPDDRKYNQEEGNNWFPENNDPKVRCDIAGFLHEMLNTARKEME